MTSATVETKVPPRDRQGLRTGFTTGACAAAAAKAATRCLVSSTTLTEIETTLPNRDRVTFALRRSELHGATAICSVIKDAGDDPDCTHGAELVAEVRLTREPPVEIRGGEGVATVTKPGLGLEVGAPAVNPVPRRNITAMVEEELEGSDFAGAVVTISVPGGEAMALETTNARLGLLGGISILGTSGIVKPYSTAAYRASVVQAIDVARERGITDLVLTTGGKSEAYAMRLFPSFQEDAFIQVGDFIGTGLRHCARRGATRAVIVGMIGKLSKMADGKMMTHAAGSEVNMELLASIAAEIGATDALLAEIRAANTARHVLELCAASGVSDVTSGVCRRVVAHGAAHAGGAMAVEAYLVDFNGALLGQHPPHPSQGSIAAPAASAAGTETP
jgi:cobalt-precorrin-5B (C1)-methyltransferase